MQDLVQSSSHVSHEKIINFRFSSPISNVIFENGYGIIKFANENQKADQLEFDLLIECTGFKQNQKFENLVQDGTGKFITNERNLLKENVYACGWARTGPKGNIADSMSEALYCANSISTDLLQKGKNNKIDVQGMDFKYFNFEKYK